MQGVPGDQVLRKCEYAGKEGRDTRDGGTREERRGGERVWRGGERVRKRGITRAGDTEGIVQSFNIHYMGHIYILN